MIAAAQKMREAGLSTLAPKVGRSLSVMYRWVKALENGTGIRDTNKNLLIDATRNTPHAITWDDFRPASEIREAA